MKAKSESQTVKRNVRLYYAFRVLCTMNFVMPIFMLFLLDRGLSSFEIMITQAVYAGVELLLTVPSGAFADKVGRKRTLILSTVFYAVAFAGYGFVHSFVQVLLVEVVFAISSALFHGTGEAFLYDTLAEQRQESRYKKVLGNAYAIQSVVLGVAAVVGGFMAAYDLALPFMVSAVPVSLSVIPLLFLREPKRVKTDDDCWKLVKESTKYTLKNRTIRNLFYYSAVTTLVGYVGFMLIQPTLTGMGMKLEGLGIVVMLVSVSSAIGNKLASRLDDRFKQSTLLLVMAGSRALLYLLVWLGTGSYVAVWFLLFDFVSGVSWPLMSGWINSHSQAHNRATVNSLSSMAGMMSFTLFSPLLGMLADVYSTQQVYLVLAALLGLYVVRQALVLVLSRQK